MFQTILDKIVRLKIWTDTNGQDIVEWALMVSMVTISIGAFFPPVGDSLSTIFSKLSSTAKRAP